MSIHGVSSVEFDVFLHYHKNKYAVCSYITGCQSLSETFYMLFKVLAFENHHCLTQAPTLLLHFSILLHHAYAHIFLGHNEIM